jgi:hypothetical protein
VIEPEQVEKHYGRRVAGGSDGDVVFRAGQTDIDLYVVEGRCPARSPQSKARW